MPRDLDANMRDIDRFGRELERFSTKALPHAARDALNRGAFAGRKRWLVEMGRAFVLRNKFAARSVRVEKARLARRVDGMEAVLGSVAPFQRRREEGGTERGKGGRLAIPTRVAAGQSMGPGARTKNVQRPNKMRAIQITKRVGSGGNRRQRNAIAIGRAARAGGRNRFAVIDTARGKAIVKVTGRKRKRVRAVWDLSRSSVQVPPMPTLRRTVDAIDGELPGMYVAALRTQVRRLRIFQSR